MAETEARIVLDFSFERFRDIDPIKIKDNLKTKCVTNH